MNLLITGAKGQLGQEVLLQLKNGKSALGNIPKELTEANAQGVDLDDANLASLAEARALIKKYKPDAVINCAAFTNVNAAEAQQDEAFAGNVVAPRNLAIACEEAGAKLLHVSTDYVFGSGKGRTQPIPETDLPSPLGVYGKTKLLGEEYTRQFCSRAFIVRTAWLYGKNGGNFVKTMMKLTAEKDEVKVVNDQFGSPTNAEDLAHHLLKIVCTEEYGIYHCTGGGVCTWYDFAKAIARLSGGKANVLPCTSDEFPTPVERPAYSALDNMMLRVTVGDEMRTWQKALESYFENTEEN